MIDKILQAVHILVELSTNLSAAIDSFSALGLKYKLLFEPFEAVTKSLALG